MHSSVVSRSQLPCRRLHGGPLCRRAAFYAALVFLLSQPAERLTLQAQAPQADKPAPVYDVASIRESKADAAEAPSRFFTHSHSGSLEAENLKVDFLIQYAYGMRPDQIVGEPDWFHTRLFTIYAKSGDSTRETLSHLSDIDARRENREMLQALLVQRFHLQAHTESRRRPIYVLAVAKNGPKLHHVQTAATAPAGSVGTAGTAAEQPQFSEGCETAGCAGIWRNAALSQLTVVLEGMCHAPVVDRTGLTGDYDFTLRPAKDSCDGSGTAGDWPPLATALREQLGLTLKSAKGPVQVLVIDHVEMPTPN